MALQRVLCSHKKNEVVLLSNINCRSQWHKLSGTSSDFVLWKCQAPQQTGTKMSPTTVDSRRADWMLLWCGCFAAANESNRKGGVTAFELDYGLWTGVTDCCCHSSQSSSEVATTTSVTSPWSLQHIFPSVSLRRQPSDYNSVSVYIIVIALAFCKTLVLYRYNVVNRELYCLMHLGDLASKKSKFARNYVHNSVIFKDKCLQHHQNVGMFSNHFSVVEPIRAVSISL